ncbi:hypothetical protein M407DRAFT_29721 [Tulasnella calospora MUT 4182]|uniref:Zn(2)-C6 fungal-type domain-containing protein n=1 Tax=Tulasnella calospora MUT 4182 TaxID=1051891 RepID=A0A0C3LGS9_9AGAM|nr:hypothetical protein M407DRAFT_29721 [Tulasnella calospora MUT 4182]
MSEIISLPDVCLSITAVPPPQLRRNQACGQYRKRKLICDAQKPHCSTCVKQWNAQIAVAPPVSFSYLPQPLCVYDRMKGLSLTPLNADQVDDPKQRINLLESQIAKLQQKLVAAQIKPGISSPNLLSLHHSNVVALTLIPIHDPQQHFQYQWPPPASNSRPSSAASGVQAISSSAFANQDATTNPTSMSCSANSSRIFPGNVDMDSWRQLGRGCMIWRVTQLRDLKSSMVAGIPIYPSRESLTTYTYSSVKN